ncbi:hypothetical protein BB560_007297 [Smittium megazygosporum]|uniref:Small-subunit processome Utp12 domain-containing protein n=1 Tax=Smittium megazygosporum TaxID=133381 RepID=A0A2T9XX30_9FUNG|nr:hypothetical protein BB560_007297 [Smittium megazygosporum]
MVKVYQRYQPKATFGIISSPRSNTVFSSDSLYAIAGALDQVIVWDLRKAAIHKHWSDPENSSQVTVIARSCLDQYAVGYADGSIRFFSFSKDDSPFLIFNGHKSAISALSFDTTGTILCSGSSDTDLVLWDMVGEVGLFRLKGHKDQITDIAFLPLEASNTISGQSTQPDLDVGSSINSLVEQEDTLLESNTSAFSAGSSGFLITSSKDTLVKVWDLESRNCIQTITSHKSEVWSLSLSPDFKTLVTGSSDNGLRLFNVDPTSNPNSFNSQTETTQDESATLQNVIKGGTFNILQEAGVLQKHSKDRVISVHFHPSSKIFACLTNDKSIEFFYVCSNSELLKKISKKNRQSKKKSSDEQQPSLSVENSLALKFVSRQIIRLTSKVKSFDFNPLESKNTVVSKQGHHKVLFSLTNNSISIALLDNSVYLSSSANYSDSALVPKWQPSIERPGHRSEPKCIALSNDNELVATACVNVIRIWNVATNSCLREIPCSQVLCLVFLPGDQYLAAGTKIGTIELFDLSSNVLLSSFEAHANGCYAISVKPDKSGLVSGGADSQIKFWNFELYSPQSNGNSSSRNQDFSARKLTLVHTRTLKLSDSALSIAISPDSKLLAVSLLDTTVRVFYLDTLKFYLSLYGHKLPVLSIDISSDSQLLISGSADKNVKIWGLDFGDCHKSLFAHKDTVTCVKFVWDTHYFFSCSKDHVVSMWDADKFVKIQNMAKSPHSDVWALAVAKFGNFVVAASQDRTIRIWEKTEEPLFLEEERELELEQQNEQVLLDDLNSSIRNGLNPVGSVNVEDLEDGVAVSNNLNNETNENDNDARATDVYGVKHTLETLKSGEKLVEAVTLVQRELEVSEKYKEDLEKSKNNKMIPAPLPPPKNVILKAMNIDEPEEYLLSTIEKIRPSELEDAMLALPLEKFHTLLVCMNKWVQKKGSNVQLVTKILSFLLKSNIHQVNNMQHLRQDLMSLRDNLRSFITQQKSVVGVNLSYLKSLQKDWELHATKDLFDETAISEKLDSKVLKRKFLGFATN